MNSFPLSDSLGFSGNTFKAIKVTNDQLENGRRLLETYDSIDEDFYDKNNKFTLFLPPGKYDLGNKALNLYKESVNIIGLGEGADQQHIISFRPTGAVVNILHDNLNIKNLTIANTYTIENPTELQRQNDSAYNKANTIKMYGLFAPTSLYYLYKFTIKINDDYILFKNLNNTFYSETYGDTYNPFPNQWNLNFFNTPIYRGDNDVYIAKFENNSNNLPLKWYMFTKSSEAPFINILKFSDESYVPFPWQCKSWKTFTNPPAETTVDFKPWPWPQDYNNIENIILPELFWSLTMPTNSCFIGNFKNVQAGLCSFGGYDGYAAGKFENCVGGFYSFGHPWDYNRQNQDKLVFCSGEFISCKAKFGSFGHEGLIAGSFENCHQFAYEYSNDMDVKYTSFGQLTGDGSSITNCFSYGTGVVTPDTIESSVTIWDESVNGDLSNNPEVPTPVGSVEGFASSVFIVKNTLNLTDPDYFSLSIPTNKKVSEILLKSFSSSSSALVGIQSGIGWTAGNNPNLAVGIIQIDSTSLNQNLLSLMNVNELTQGNITFRNQYFGEEPVEIEYEIKTVLV